MNQSHLTTQTIFFPIYCEKGDDKVFILMFDNGHKNDTTLTDINISLKNINPCQNRHKQKQVKKTNPLAAASSSLLNDSDFHSDDDDKIDEKIPSREEMNYP